jgi:eukaryotic-like serine/threonine-protein kinase
MPLASGSRLGPYEIQSAIGAGGMGEVYKARDTRLDRTVAVKVLPESLSSDPQFRERFDREARTISQLDHPHICALYDVGEQAGSSFLVMQYLEGETLEARLKKGALPLDQALQVAIQIADALDKAHHAGIVHRDLKPGNVMLTKGGAKLLDFGLAKANAASPTPVGFSMLPTTPPGLTAQGTILGTFQYMAPEQLEGHEADARTDIFAFGAMVYEMITGRRAFEGRSQASLIGAILERDPIPPSALQPASPTSIDHVITRCLAKDPGERWQTASDLRHELSWIARSDSPIHAVPQPGAATRSTWALGAAVIFLLSTLALGGLAIHQVRSATKPAVVRFFVFPPEKNTFASGVPAVTAAVGSISPDGTRLSFTAIDNSGKSLLWIRRLDSLAAQPLAGTDGAYLPFWSPDGRWIAFFGDGKLRKVDSAGGPPQTLGEAPAGRGGTWSQDGATILFAPNNTGPLFRVLPAGGQPVAVTKLTPSQTSHQFPAFLPDGRHFVFSAQGGTGNGGIFVGSLDAGEPTRLMAADTSAVYAPPGYLLFMREGTLLGQAFNAGALQLEGDPFPMGDDKVATDFANSPAFSISNTGVLSYRLGSGSHGLQLGWYDRAGKLLDTIGAPRNYRGIDLSPDDKRIAVHPHDGGGGDIWLLDATSGPTSRFTFDASQDNSSPIWSPDGSLLAFSSIRNGKWGLYVKASSGVGNEKLLLETETPTIPMSWSPDGRSLVYATQNQSRDMFALPVTGDRKSIPVVSSPFDESHGQVSPDGRWIAYEASETGQMQIYVRPFPSGDGKWQLSSAGGFWPRWRRDGKELFYVQQAVAGKLMTVDISAASGALQPSTPRTLFEFSSTGALPHSFVYHTFAVSADGQRFLIPKPVSGSADEVASPITVVLNWQTVLGARDWR